NIGMSLHSDRELGISSAAAIHVAASETMISHSIDTHLLEQADDIITAPFRFEGGKVRVPEGPGLGVEIDRDKLEFYARRHREVGEVSEFQDPAQSTFRAKFPKF
ncbi:glucarate dehydratase, partial [Streptomyces albiflaviniger]|nr:glucarate dehydratase [Streptomyces albiflaviniger]